MQFDWLRRLVQGKPAPPHPASASKSPSTASRNPPSPGDATLRYPPSDQGLPLLQVDALLAANADLVARLRTHAAQTDVKFDQQFLKPLERLAAHINALPATSSGLFSGPTGLFRAAVECSFYAFQASDGRIFTGSEGVERRHLLESRWRYLCFLAGMFYPIGRSLERLVVSGPDGSVWKRHFGGVTEWAGTAGVQQVFVSWGSTEDAEALGPSNATLPLVPEIVGAENLQMLEDGAVDLITSLYEVIAGTTATSRIAHQVVSGAWGRIMDREAARRPQAFGRLVAGTHLGPYLAGALRTLVEQGVWKPNSSCLKADKDGLYLAWPQAAADLIQFGRGQGYQGWPNDAATIAALLRAANLVRADASDVGTVEFVDANGEIVPTLQILNPLSVIEDYDPSHYAGRPGKTLSAVLAADPLVKSEMAAATASGVGTEAAAGHDLARAAVHEHTSSGPAATPSLPPASRAAAAAEPQLQRAEATGSDPAFSTPSVESAGVPSSEAAAEHRPSPAAQPAGRAAQEPSSPRLKEAPEVRYSDLVPEDIRQDIGQALHVELLGKMVMAWRNKGDNSEVMRRVDQGAAFALSFLTSNMRDAVTWVDHMAKAGLVYAPKDKPGLRVHKVAMPEGRKPEPAVILTSLACRRLGL